MYNYLLRILFLIPCLWANWVFSSTNVVHHQLSVTLKPSSGYIHVIDTITLPENSDYDSFILNNRLSLKHTSSEKMSANILSIKNIPASSDFTFGAKQYFFDRTQKKFKIEYSGKIVSSLSNENAEFSLNMRDSAGIISQEGVYLTRASIWYPVFSNELINFDLDVQLPKNWHSVSQGVRTTTSASLMENWKETQAQDELYLLAAKYHVYSATKDDIEALVFLQQQDDPLAKTYIDTTFHYIAMYSNLLGAYPYGKFAMVENFWETGFGMPSFTLLGPRVLRFPFILYTSYPHEILHNWWANGVFVDYKQGNWAEGLTSYLADHLLKEQRHQGHQYRRDVLQKYNDYVTDSTDIPLNKFYARHNSALEAIGYGKTLMMFHMLRIKLGDQTFIQSLKNLYRERLFKPTSYNDIQQAFEKTSSIDLTTFFKQWVSRTGAPALSIKDYAVKSISDKSNIRYELSLTLKQQNGHPYELDIPLAVSLETTTMAHQTILNMTRREQTFNIVLAHKPLNFRIDPQFDVFRQVDSSEIPPALSQGFGAEHVSIILAKESPATLLTHYQNLAAKWSQTQAGQWRVIIDSEIKDLPSNGAVWIVGWQNKYTAHFKSLIAKNVSWEQKNIRINGKTYDTKKHSFVLSTRDQHKPQQTLLWLATTNVQAIPGLMRKLPHYRKYSYLAFLGDAPTNVAKGQWDTLTSPLIRVLDNQANFATLASRNALVH